MPRTKPQSANSKMSPLREIVSGENTDLWSVVGRYLGDKEFVRCCMLSKATSGLHNLKQLRARFERAQRFDAFAFAELMRSTEPSSSMTEREIVKAERAVDECTVRTNGLASAIKACVAKINISAMPLKELKQFILDAGSSHVGIIEKIDLLEKARDIQARIGSVNENLYMSAYSRG